MQPFRFIHCGDLHLGAPFSYIGSLSKTVDQAVRKATYTAFQTVIDTAVQSRVQAVLITGDIYNSDDHNLEAQVQFCRGMETLYEANIPVYIVTGNHDPLDSWGAHIQLPKNVHVFPSHEVTRFPLIVNRVEIGGIYGRSIGRGQEHEDFTSQYIPKSSDDFSIALLHGSVNGYGDDHRTVGPCSLQSLVESGMDYWALGHIHKRQVLHETPYVVYAGNTQGLHVKEQGPKGFYIVQVSTQGHCELDFHETSAIRMETASISITGLEKESEIREMLRHKKEMLRSNLKKNVLLAITLTGTGSLHTMCASPDVRHIWLQEAMDSESSRHPFIVPYRLWDDTTDAFALDEWRHKPGVVGDYLQAFQRIAGDVDAVRRIVMGRPEMKRLQAFTGLLSDDLLRRAATKAEREGATKLREAMDED